MLCFNVTAGIGILEKASSIYQDYFSKAASPAALTASAAGFVALLSLANMTGRFAWSTLSDQIGRKNAYRLYLGVGALLYLTTTLMQNSNKVVFLICTAVIVSYYGSGFSTVPAYLRDLFGTYQVGAIHGLSFWIMISLLVVASVSNELIRPVNHRFHEPGTSPTPAPATTKKLEVAS